MNNLSETFLPALRGLYSRHGYTQYKMSKFEEYDLYVRNKDFLISDSVITFTDTNGKLMALKPDVTLSIIRNGRDLPGCVQKVYYNENVYRVSEQHGGFREIMQAGLECIGDIDNYCLYEVLMLAAASLKAIADDCVLDISHLGILSAVIEELSPQPEVQRAIMTCVGEKNLHELRRLCSEVQADPAATDLLSQLMTVYGSLAQVLPRLHTLLAGRNTEALAQLETLLAAFEGSGLESLLRLDFSVVSDMKYYNGIVFKGFINGVPDSVLSGGQYDRLMQRLHRRSGAIGFAVYMASQTLVLLALFIASLFSPDLMNLFITNEATISMSAIKTLRSIPTPIWTM